MENKEYGYVSKKCYEKVNENVVECDADFCVVGNMGNDHKTEISIKIYPISYDGLNERIRKAKSLKKESYQKFIEIIKRNDRNTPPHTCAKPKPNTLAIVLSVLGSLLFLICCCCCYRRFCRADSSYRAM